MQLIGPHRAHGYTPRGNAVAPCPAHTQRLVGTEHGDVPCRQERLVAIVHRPGCLSASDRDRAGLRKGCIPPHRPRGAYKMTSVLVRPPADSVCRSRGEATCHEAMPRHFGGSVGLGDHARSSASPSGHNPGRQSLLRSSHRPCHSVAAGAAGYHITARPNRTLRHIPSIDLSAETSRLAPVCFPPGWQATVCLAQRAMRLAMPGGACQIAGECAGGDPHGACDRRRDRQPDLDIRLMRSGQHRPAAPVCRLRRFAARIGYRSTAAHIADDPIARLVAGCDSKSCAAGTYSRRVFSTGAGC